VSILQIGKEQMLLHLLHKGKTRGLTIWRNEKGEVIFCSRKEPIIEVLGNVLNKDDFTEQVSISYREERDLSTTLKFKFEQFHGFAY